MYLCSFHAWITSASVIDCAVVHPKKESRELPLEYLDISECQKREIRRQGNRIKPSDNLQKIWAISETEWNLYREVVTFIRMCYFHFLALHLHTTSLRSILLPNAARSKSNDLVCVCRRYLEPQPSNLRDLTRLVQLDPIVDLH